MRIIVNHLTRMQPGFICVAGLDVRNFRHVRPVKIGRLRDDLLESKGGPFNIAAIVDLGTVGSARHQSLHNPSPRAGFPRRNDYTVKTLISQRMLTDKDKTQIELVRTKLAKQDTAIREYLDAHQVAERVKEGSLRGEPAPGMPEALLLLIGRYDIKAETERSKEVEFVRFGYSWETWHLVIVDGKVSSQREAKGRFGEYTTCVPR